MSAPNRRLSSQQSVRSGKHQQQFPPPPSTCHWAHVTHTPCFSCPVQFQLKAAEAMGWLAWWQAGGPMPCTFQQKTAGSFRHVEDIHIPWLLPVYLMSYLFWLKCPQTRLIWAHKMRNGPPDFFHLIWHSTSYLLRRPNHKCPVGITMVWSKTQWAS